MDAIGTSTQDTQTITFIDANCEFSGTKLYNAHVHTQLVDLYAGVKYRVICVSDDTSLYDVSAHVYKSQLSPAC